MSNNGPQIVKKQNEAANIRMLASQKEIYSSGKLLFIIQTAIAVPIPILISLITTFYNTVANQYVWIFSLYTIVGSFSELILDGIISNLKKSAATIQEQFDHCVLGIQWNSTLLPNKPDSEIIYRYYKKHVDKHGFNKLYDWYSPEVKEVATNLATVLCQRTNCTYDFSLRKKYSSTILIVAIITFSLLFLISASAGITIKSFIIEVLVPSLPVFVLAWKQVSANKESINNLSFLKGLIEGILSNAHINTIVNETIIRQIQDKIYYNRVLSPLLSDWIVNKLRKNLEGEMHFSVQEKVRELRDR